MTLDLALIGAVAGQEAARQQTDLAGLVRLLRAYQWAYDYCDDPLTMVWLKSVAEMVEPKNYQGRYRCTPVTFQNGGSSANWADIPRLMWNWTNTETHWPVDARIKELLWIHPWDDGNGRVAWIVRTRLTDTWESPENLPNYFGE